MSTPVETRRLEVCEPGADSQAMAVDAATALAGVLKALADPARLRMLSHLVTSERGEACVCDLAELTDVSQPTVSHHLKVLKREGVLESDRRGTWVWYRLTPGLRQPVTDLLDRLAPAVLTAVPTTPTAPLLDPDRALDHVVDDLAGRFPHLSAELVQRTVRESYTGLSRTATVRSHLISLTERFARQRLTDLGRDRDTAPPQVLFVCVANAGRSQLAAALLRHYAGDRVVVRSAGSSPAGAVHTNVAGLLAELGSDTEDTFPKPLTDDAVRAADVVVTMGCGDVCPVVPGVRYEEWAVADPALATPSTLTSIRADLDRRVRALLTDLVPDLHLPTR
ncbi:metalloregulator ArsR/SmtB family transcription factor [Auraticoccus monumenti]|uniref:ArsR family transcriptional regulator n=1 Tax=Auraticoccus monumenti TaxID=675864 RepID=A0A1G6ZN80_9ACTN|nr:metalloregulator ArsR/SmtB family transcription factor [Auraticoccus monumenti]SDE03981.1 ArsR family transcriptional regulator [Auraticoccus monumenti]